MCPPQPHLSDIASVKRGLPEFYAEAGHPYVSTHPMFVLYLCISFQPCGGERHRNIGRRCRGIEFFSVFAAGLGLHVEQYTFREHDRTIAYSLSVPFASSLVFGSAMKPQPAPGTTFKRRIWP